METPLDTQVEAPVNPPLETPSEVLGFATAFKYPFNRPVGLLNILWALIPIIGWFALGGYGVRIIQEFCKGQFKELPRFKFGDDLVLGFMMFIKGIPLMLAYGIITGILFKIHMVVGGLFEFFTAFLVLPVLVINYFVKETVASSFEFEVVKPVFSHLGDYIIAMLKSLALGIIFMFMWIILIGISAGAFSKNIFLADFYRRRVK